MLSTGADGGWNPPGPEPRFPARVRWSVPLVSTDSTPRRLGGHDDQADFQRRYRICRTCGLLAWCALLLGAAPADAAEGGRHPVEVLERDKGLTRHANGTVWVCRYERRLREHLASLDEARSSVVRLQNQLDEGVKRNAVLWATSREQIAVLEQTKAQLKQDDPKRKQIDRQIEELRRQAVEPKRLGGEPDVRKRLVELINARNRLTLAVLGIRSLTARLEGEYQHLAQDPAVRAALQQLGAGHRLGPLHTNYRADLLRLADYERVVFTEWAPLYFQGRGPRFGVLVNERTPIVCTWQETSEPTVLTASMAEAAGLAIPADAPTVELTFPGNRKLTTRTVTLPTLRVGRWVLSDVPAQVLPPEGEDLGAQIGPRAFPQHRVTLEPERLRVLVQAK
jgi:hypothetical protein